MRIQLSSIALLAALPLTGCAVDDHPTDIVNPGGKADLAGVEAAVEDLTSDGELSADDIEALFKAAGNNVSLSEMLAIRDATESTRYDVTSEALATALALAYEANLFDYEKDQLAFPELGFGGSEIPRAVRDLVARAKLNGAISFDVNETKSNGEGKWSPYPSTTPPTGNMDFSHTLVTPKKLADDIADSQVTYNVISGSTSETTPSGQEYTQAAYVERTGGTGNIAAQYDEYGHHPDLYARGGSGQIWASNCAFLSDGTVHCLPAARRSVSQDLILTNPHLSRCNRKLGYEEDCHTIMYMGHISASRGVITSIEVSGRVSKRVAKGQVNLIDPISLLEAWGFDLSTASVHYGNTEDGVPVRDADRGVLTGR